MIHPYPIDEDHFKKSAEKKAELLLERWWQDNRLSFSDNIHYYYWLILPFWLLVFSMPHNWAGSLFCIFLLFKWLRIRNKGATPYPDIGGEPIMVLLSKQVRRLRIQSRIATISILGIFPASYLGKHVKINGWIWTTDNHQDIIVIALIYTFVNGLIFFFFGVGFTYEEIKRGENILNPN